VIPPASEGPKHGIRTLRERRPVTIPSRRRVVKTRLAEPAKREARRMHRWWKANRPKLFALELAEARRQIAEKPDIGHVYAVRAGGVTVRRVLMPKTSTHVFYELQQDEDVAMIVALWGATKEHGTRHLLVTFQSWVASALGRRSGGRPNG
jgi:hypothetical protein